MGGNKVLVTASTGKCGFKCCLALKDEGFQVFGTTRSVTGAEKLKSIGVTPLVGNYLVAEDLARMIDESGANKLLFYTDFWTAAGGNADTEFEQGKLIIDTTVSSGRIEHAVFISVADAECWPPECAHILAKVKVEDYLKESSLKCWSVVGPACFFENLDDPVNHNPLKKGSLKFLMTESCKWCGTYDIGKAAAVQFKNPRKWNKKPRLDVIGYEGDLDSCADALEKVGGYAPVKRSLVLPVFIRKIMKDLHFMCEFFAKRIGEGIRGTPEEFRKHVPDALDAEGWFRHHNKYTNGEPIVDNSSPPEAGCCTMM